jgi:hypothetical protein
MTFGIISVVSDLDIFSQTVIQKLFLEIKIPEAFLSNQMKKVIINDEPFF